MPDDKRFPEPKIAQDYLKNKVNVETENWDDMKWGEHAYGFTVAHSMNAGVLDAIHGYLNDCIQQGKSFNDFRNSMLDMMTDKGWYGGAGHKKDEKDYKDWRIGVIYDTNMRTAYAAEHYRKQLEVANTRPIWVYHHSPFVKKARPDHLALDGKAYRYDDPFWDTYYPPNGWGCKCYVTTLSESQAKNQGIDVKPSDPSELPAIDETWAYNIGQQVIAPSFTNFVGLKNLKAKIKDPETGKEIKMSAIRAMRNSYADSIKKTCMTKGEFKLLLRDLEQNDQHIRHIFYQVGTVSGDRAEALYNAGVPDCKIMAIDKQLWHGTADKIQDQRIKPKFYDDLYDTLQEPDNIYRAIGSEGKETGTEFHFIKLMPDGDTLKVVLRLWWKGITSLQVVTMGKSTYKYTNTKLYEKIW